MEEKEKNMKVKGFLKWAFYTILLYALIAASIIPSPAMKYALNLTMFISVLIFFLAILIVLCHDGAIETCIKKARAKDKLEETKRKFEKGSKRLTITYIPIILALVISGHWIVGLSWMLLWTIILGLYSKLVEGFETEIKIQGR